MHELLPKPVCGSMEEKEESAKLEKGSSQQGSYRSNLGGSCQRECSGDRSGQDRLGVDGEGRGGEWCVMITG